MCVHVFPIEPIQLETLKGWGVREPRQHEQLSLGRSHWPLAPSTVWGDDLLNSYPALNSGDAVVKKKKKKKKKLKPVASSRAGLQTRVN